MASKEGVLRAKSVIGMTRSRAGNVVRATNAGVNKSIKTNLKSKTRGNLTADKKAQKSARVLPARAIAKKKLLKASIGRTGRLPAKPLSQEKIDDLILEHRANARKLSRSILRRWRSRLELEELDSLVDLALCEAAQRYNPRKGASFMTFLFYHLRGTLVRAVDAAANLNTIPASSMEVSELAFDYSTESYKNGTFRGGNANDIAASLSNQEYLLPDEIVYKRQVAEISQDACGKLDQLEQQVIYRLYALEEPLVDIAKSLGYSRCHISRVKRKALETLYEDLNPVVGDPNQAKPVFEEEDAAKVSRRPVARRKLHRLIPQDNLGNELLVEQNVG